MGRYYSGDIEGKFWFGVQSSDDASFFGGEQEASYIPYYYDESNLPQILEGLQSCLEALNANKKLTNFIIKGKLKEENENEFYKLIEGKDAEWSARLEIGKKIYDCVKANGECSFDAEL